MSVCVYSVFMLYCVQVAALRRAGLPSRESDCRRSRNWKGPAKGCSAIDVQFAFYFPVIVSFIC
jgi:hypothetical protein